MSHRLEKLYLPDQVKSTGDGIAAIKEHGQEAVQLVRWLVDPLKAMAAKKE